MRGNVHLWVTLWMQIFSSSSLPQVDLLREKIADYFLIETSLLVCGRTATVVINMYTVIRFLMGVDQSYNSYWLYRFVYLACSIATLLHLCFSALHFSRHVSLVDFTSWCSDAGERYSVPYVFGEACMMLSQCLLSNQLSDNILNILATWNR